MKLSALTANLGLKLLALALAIVIYHALKPEKSTSGNAANDTRLFQYR